MGSSYRVGLVVPSSNVTMETEIPALLRAYEAANPGLSFTFHGARMRMTSACSRLRKKRSTRSPSFMLRVWSTAT